MSVSQNDNIAVCIGCGCDDLNACYDEQADGPCRWLRVDRKARKGVCSACPEHATAWDNGDRDSRVPMDER